MPGNDDSGGLSSWYVWASLGLFPVAGQDLYLLHAPTWRAGRLSVGDAQLELETTGFAEPEPDGPVNHVQTVTLDGRPLDRSWISGDELRRGGRLLVELGPTPSGWGTATASRPPSTTVPPTNGWLP